jgi:hypothetical protein
LHLAPNVFDVWAFQRRADGIVFLLLYTSAEKATRHFNGGRFWQIPRLESIGWVSSAGARVLSEIITTHHRAAVVSSSMLHTTRYFRGRASLKSTQTGRCRSQ